MRRVLILAAALALASCGGDSAPLPSGVPGGNTPNTPGGGGGNTPSPTAAVTIGSGYFSPTPLSIKVGTMVTWTNDDVVAHTTTSDNGTWMSGQLASNSGGGYYGGSSGGSYSFTFSATGTYAYHCSNHPDMMGTITVTP